MELFNYFLQNISKYYKTHQRNLQNESPETSPQNSFDCVINSPEEFQKPHQVRRNGIGAISIKP